MWKTIDSRVIHKSRFISVNQDTVQLEDGSIIPDYYTADVSDAVMILAITTQNKIILKKEYRHACKQDMVECPAGMIESGELPENAAVRELLEETGYTSEHWIYLGPTKECSSRLTNTLHLYFANQCIKTHEQNLDPNERIEIVLAPTQQVHEMIMNGIIASNSTVHAFYMAQKTLENIDGL